MTFFIKICCFRAALLLCPAASVLTCLGMMENKDRKTNRLSLSLFPISLYLFIQFEIRLSAVPLLLHIVYEVHLLCCCFCFEFFLFLISWCCFQICCSPCFFLEVMHYSVGLNPQTRFPAGGCGIPEWSLLYSNKGYIQTV